MSHKIEEVRFTEAAAKGLPSSAAPLRCSCGWSGVSGTFDAHRGQTATQTRVARNHLAWTQRQEGVA